MRNQLLTLVFISMMSLASFGQYNFDYGISAGGSSSLGEIGSGAAKKSVLSSFDFGNIGWSLGGFARYKVIPNFAFKGALNYLRLSGDDKNSSSPTRKARNLNFKNDIFDISTTGEIYVYSINDVGGTGRYNPDFNLYVFGGISAFFSNPKGQDDLTGDWVSLRPLKTEGVTYSSLNLSIPVGVGFYYTLQRKFRLGLEFGWRFTFTDYLDDISTAYAHDYDGISNKTSQQLLNEINNETGEVADLLVDYFAAGDKRGNSENNDAYMSATVNFSWVIKGKSRFNKSKSSWMLGKKKGKRRKSRAKF
jgi:hypothetical protein